MSTLSAREVSSIMPKWSQTGSIVDYCKKIQLAWTYCHTESFDEEKFCKIIFIQLPEEALDVLDSLTSDEKKLVNKIVGKLMQAFGRKENDYLRELSASKKEPTETHNHFARRIQRLYRLGTGSKEELSEIDKKFIVDFFLKGLSANEESTLRLVATDTEMKDVSSLADRASRAPATSAIAGIIASNNRDENEYFSSEEEHEPR